MHAREIADVKAATFVTHACHVHSNRLPCTLPERAHVKAATFVTQKDRAGNQLEQPGYVYENDRVVALLSLKVFVYATLE